MMMLSSTEAVSSARANNIISNLRNLKTAALAWYVDSLDMVEASGFTLADTTHFPYVKHYLNNETSNELDGTTRVYHIEQKKGSDNVYHWYVYYDKSKADANVRLKLSGRAKSVGLLAGEDYKNTFTGTDTKIGMLVR